jgi:hypothetical protein
MDTQKKYVALVTKPDGKLIGLLRRSGGELMYG